MSKKKKNINKLLASTISASVATSAIVAIAPGASAAANTFKDVPSNEYFYEAVNSLHARNIIKGYDDGTFRPYDALTRAEAAKIIALALDLDMTNVKNPGFKDVPKENWAYKYISALANEGIIAGYNGEYKPKEPLTRAEMAKIISLAYQFESGDSSQLPFTDVKQGDWFAHHVEALVENKITSGTSPTTFSPKINVTRGQIAAFVYRSENSIIPVEVSEAISNITNGTLVTSQGTYTLSDEYKKWINPSNLEALKGATIKLTAKNDKIEKIKWIDMTAKGSISGDASNPYSNHAVFDGKGATVDADITVNGDYFTMKNVTINGDLHIGKGVENSFFSEFIRVEGETTIDDSLQLVNQVYKSQSFKSASTSFLAAANETEARGRVVFSEFKLDKVDVDKNADVIFLSKKAGTSTVGEIIVNNNATFTADQSVTIPKLVISQGATDVSINSNVTSLQITATGELELSGKGDIANVLITTKANLTLQTQGKVGKLETSSKETKITLGSATKVANLVVPSGSKPSDIIGNYNKVKANIEKIGGIKNPDITAPSNNSGDDEDNGTTKPTTPVAPAPPTGLQGVAPTTPIISNGKITGLDATKLYQYRLLTAADWTNVPALSTEITGLAAGNYAVRIAPNGNTPASTATAVTVNVFESPLVIGGLTVTAVDDDNSDDKTKIHVVESPGANNEFVYKVHNGIVELPKLDEVVSESQGWSKLPDDGIIIAENGNGVIVVERTKSGQQAKKFGTTIAKTEVEAPLTAPDAPAGLQGIALTSNQNDGKIIGLDPSKTYQYKLMNASNWIDVNPGATEITHLPVGSYEVRIAANGNTPAGASAQVTIQETQQGQSQEPTEIYTFSYHTSGVADMVRVSNAPAGAIVKVYDSSTGGNVIGSATSQNGWAFVSIPTGFYPNMDKVFVTYTENGKSESNRVEKVIPTTFPEAPKLSDISIINNYTGNDIVKVKVPLGNYRVQLYDTLGALLPYNYTAFQYSNYQEIELSVVPGFANGLSEIDIAVMMDSFDFSTNTGHTSESIRTRVSKINNQLLEAVMLDGKDGVSSQDGQVETIRLKFSEKFNPETVIENDAFTVDGFEVDSIKVTDKNGRTPKLSDGTEDPLYTIGESQYITIRVTPKPGTNFAPMITQNEAITDINGVSIAGIYTEAKDQAAPVIVSSSFIDNGASGMNVGDQISITFSEDVWSSLDANLSDDFTLYNATNDNFAFANDDQFELTGNTVTVTLGSTTVEKFTQDTTITMSANGSAISLEDFVGNKAKPQKVFVDETRYSDPKTIEIDNIPTPEQTIIIPNASKEQGTDAGTIKLTGLMDGNTYQYIVDNNQSLEGDSTDWTGEAAVTLSGVTEIDNISVNAGQFVHIRIAETTVQPASNVQNLEIVLNDIKPDAAPTANASSSNSGAGFTKLANLEGTIMYEYFVDDNATADDNAAGWANATSILADPFGTIDGIPANSSQYIHIRVKATEYKPASYIKSVKGYDSGSGIPG